MVKGTGMSRAIDDLGRIVIPKEMRKSMHLEPGDHLDYSVQGEYIILRPVRKHCVFCQCEYELAAEHNGHRVCQKCLDVLIKNATTGAANSK